MLLTNKKTAIIGAGPVGLTMARLLQQNGINVTVYERDKDPKARIWGGTLDLHKGSGQDAMQKAGLLEEYYKKAIPMGRIITDYLGNVLFSKETSVEEQYEGPEINRNDLRTLLINSLEKDTVVWDRKLIKAEEQNNKWILHFENGEIETADFVIGANGGMTAIRKYLTDAAVEFTGTYMIQGEVSEPEIKCPDFYKLCADKILMTSNNGNLLVANPKNSNVLSYNVIFKMPEILELDFKNSDSVIEFISERFKDWDAVYKQLFQVTSFFTGLPTKKISVEEWKNNRPLPITLIGDAAHLMPPFAGQGANIGLLDALILSENLTNRDFRTVEEAVFDYEQQMQLYARKAQEETRINEIEMLKTDFTFLKFAD
ncbi:FAD-dependent oxidoreductase [Flavobacterium johnsoniae]|uniref:Flavin-dependent monooxygenase n=1 Tax=Flavobacterium johnsoniae TaxID=986 RepID=A0A1M5SW42_FLAJO|nr:NAD(P)/FAD-dependent oxidoreductase [Flavobacterium johnsoniae]SHH42726.1 tetracycline resistance monooxygenase [Flavobacterium johnsoniae]